MLYNQQRDDGIEVWYSVHSSFCRPWHSEAGSFGVIIWLLVVIRAVSFPVVWLGQLMPHVHLQISKSAGDWLKLILPCWVWYHTWIEPQLFRTQGMDFCVSSHQCPRQLERVFLGYWTPELCGIRKIFKDKMKKNCLGRTRPFPKLKGNFYLLRTYYIIALLQTMFSRWSQSPCKKMCHTTHFTDKGTKAQRV